MVCSSESGIMEVMARFLDAGSFSHTISDNFCRSAAEYICRELREADEANLLDEEDMHVYGLRPMSDPLQLVCCNFCKKPIKDSQYAAHAEICRSLNLTEQTSLELDGNTGNRKPPRRDKKKLSTCGNQAAAVVEQRRSESMENIDTAVSQSVLNSQIRVTPVFKEATGAASVMDGNGIIPGNRDHPASVTQPPAKRHRLIANTNLPLPENHGLESGVTKTVSFADGTPCKDFLERTISEHGDPHHKNLGLVHEQHMKNGFPAPLATKIYYSQRRNRLRAAIRHLYFQNLCEELCTDVMSPKTSDLQMATFQDSCQRGHSLEQTDFLDEESHSATLCSAQNSRHILAKSSEVCLLKAGGLPGGGLSNQFVVDNVSRSAATHVGLTRSNFLPKSYSFAGSTGNSLGKMQQSNGSVPVI